MGRYLSLVTGAVALAAVSAAPASAAVIFSDNFDAETLGNNALLTNFGVSDGTIDVVENGQLGITCSGHCVDLDGSSGDAGNLTSFNQYGGPGNFVLSFDLSGNQRGGADDTVRVLFGATLLDTITVASADPFTTHSYVVSGLEHIRFETEGGDNVGPILDNVLLVTQDTTTVPEPSTLAIIGSGLAVLGLWRRRRQSS